MHILMRTVLRPNANVAKAWVSELQYMPQAPIVTAQPSSSAPNCRVVLCPYHPNEQNINYFISLQTGVVVVMAVTLVTVTALHRDHCLAGSLVLGRYLRLIPAWKKHFLAVKSEIEEGRLKQQHDTKKRGANTRYCKEPNHCIRSVRQY